MPGNCTQATRNLICGKMNFATTMLPTGSLTDLATTGKLAMMGIVFLVVSMNLPALASALAGGVGISAMSQHAGGPAKKAFGMGAKGLGALGNKLLGRGSGGSINHSQP